MISTSYVTSFMSGLFKKPQTTDGFGKFVSEYNKTPYMHVCYIDKFVNRQAMTRSQYSQCAGKVRYFIQNWTKAQKKDIEDKLGQVTIIPDTQPEPVQVHTISASYNEQGQTQTIQKSAQVTEQIKQATSKIPIIVLGCGLGVILLSKLLRGSR